jgi:non-heme chloroperoxidase
MESTTKTIQINNHPFYYIERGKGNPVILIHGSLNDYRIWENQMGPLADKFRVIAYSRRFHFPDTSAEDFPAYTFTQHSDDLTDFCHKLDLQDVNLIGSSYGAYVGLLTAINNPGLVKTLVLGEPPVIPLLVSDPENPLQVLSLLLRDFSTGKNFIKFGVKAVEPAKKQLKKGNLKEGVRVFANGVLGKNGYEKLSEEDKKRIIDNAPALKAELLGPGFPATFPETEAKNLAIPVFLIYGEKSPVFFHTLSDKLLNILPDSRKSIIEGASHDMHLEKPEVYNQKVLDFLSDYN